jgi:thiamine transporter ThiT
MKFDLQQLLKLLLITFMGTAASVAVGLLVYGGDVFNPASVAFAFTAYGMSGAFIFAFYHMRGLTETLIVAIVVSAVQFVVGIAWFPWLTALLWSFGVNLPVVGLAFVFERKLAHFKQAKFVVVAITYSVMFVLLTLLVSVLRGVELMPAQLFRDNAYDGLLIGIGLGLGIEAAEALVHSYDEHKKTSAQT